MIHIETLKQFFHEKHLFMIEAMSRVSDKVTVNRRSGSVDSRMRYYVAMSDAHESDGFGLRGVYGNGSTPIEALDDYWCIIMDSAGKHSWKIGSYYYNFNGSEFVEILRKDIIK